MVVVVVLTVIVSVEVMIFKLVEVVVVAVELENVLKTYISMEKLVFLTLHNSHCKI